MSKSISKVAWRILFFVFVVPLMLIWIIVQIPFAFVGAAAKRQRDKRFAASMRTAGRLATWVDARTQVDTQHGTFVEEFVGTDGYRLWWTLEYVPDVCPYPCRFESDESAEAKNVDLPLRDRQLEKAKQLQAEVASQYAASCEWCCSRYTNPESGTAQLVEIAGSDEQEWWRYIGPGSPAGRRFICIRTN